MGIKKAFDNVEAKGLLKSSSSSGSAVQLTSSQKVQLNRRANQLFNAGNFAEAEKIFKITGYSDGLCRMGDYYMEHDQLVEALQMYYQSKMANKYEPLIEKVAAVVRSLID